jgi:hypothetical protein
MTIFRFQNGNIYNVAIPVTVVRDLNGVGCFFNWRDAVPIDLQLIEYQPILRCESLIGRDKINVCVFWAPSQVLTICTSSC